MAFAPFRDFLALIVFYRYFDLPQYLFAGLADSSTKGGNGLRGIEIKDIQKIFMLEVFSRLHAAAGQQCVGGADHGGVPKSHSDVEIIILFQKGIVNDTEDVAPVVVPVFIHKLRRDTLQLIGKTVFTGNIKPAFQRRRYHIPMLRLILPKVRAARVLAAACVGYIEYISQLGIISGGVNESNTLAAASYISAHLFVPEVVFRTGRSFRALGENHKLFVVGVLIQPRSGGQKRRPLLVASRDLPRRVVCHLCVEL